MTDVLVAHHQSLQRLGLRMLLTAQSDLTVVGEAAGEAEAVRMSERLRPDVVLMDGGDGGGPGTDGIESIRRITRPGPVLQVPGSAPVTAHPPRVLLLLTDPGDDTYVYEALRAGADGFVLPDTTPDQLAAAVRTVAAGGVVVSPGLTRELIEAVRRRRPVHEPVAGTRLGTLTERERDVLTAVAHGCSNAEIAERLSIAPTTVKSHVSHILTKIGARARVQAVSFAYETGLVRPARSRPLSEPVGTRAHAFASEPALP